MDSKVHAEPSSVASEDGLVIVDGPDAVTVTLTPEAAEETGQRLIEKAVDAAGLRHFQKPTGTAQDRSAAQLTED